MRVIVVVVNVEIRVEMDMLKGTRLAAILHPPLHPLPNQSKPIASTPSLSLP